MENIVVLQWSFTPDSYFGDEFEAIIPLDNNEYKVVVKRGKIEIHIDPSTYDQKPNFHERLYKTINNIFKAHLLNKINTFKIHKGFTEHRYYANGKKGLSLFPEPAEAYANACSASINCTMKDENGNITYDSHKERLEKYRELIDIVGRCVSKDSFAESLLDCLYRAGNNKNHEIVHLYEVREALSKKFGNQQSACQSLGLSRNEWSRLGKLANDLPLKQGRHVGKKIEELRDATSAELNEARQLAQRFVNAYLNYLDDDN